VASVKELNHVFKDRDYNLSKVKSGGGVPRLYLAKLPSDMRHQKKSSNPTFIQVLLPHILKVNEKIMADRERLLEMQARQKKGGHLLYAEKMWLMKLASDYRCKSTKVESLLVHVDVVPPSLALAQAILETGGGVSHAALKKNSPFGHMATKTKVQKFDSLEQSVAAYVQNLNRHNAYSSFRSARAASRAQKQQPCGHKLASLLVKYSVRGKGYTQQVQQIIEKFGLRGYDGSMLVDHVSHEKKTERLKP
jgi:Bax protein